MALGKDRGAINVKGGGFFKIRELKPTATDAWSDVGYLQSTEFNDEHTMVEAIDERGLQVDYVDGGQSMKLTTQLMQSDYDVLNLLKGAAGKVYEGYYKCLTAEGNYQEWNFPLCRLNPGIKMTMQASTLRAIPLEIRCLSVKANMTRTPVEYNVTEGQQYVMTENAAEKGAPSDTASTVASTLY